MLREGLGAGVSSVVPKIPQVLSPTWEPTTNRATHLASFSCYNNLTRLKSRVFRRPPPRQARGNVRVITISPIVLRVRCGICRK